MKVFNLIVNNNQFRLIIKVQLLENKIKLFKPKLLIYQQQVELIVNLCLDQIFSKYIKLNELNIYIITHYHFNYLALLPQFQSIIHLFVNLVILSVFESFDYPDYIIKKINVLIICQYPLQRLLSSQFFQDLNLHLHITKVLFLKGYQFSYYFPHHNIKYLLHHFNQAPLAKSPQAILQIFILSKSTYSKVDHNLFQTFYFCLFFTLLQTTSF